jgi:hypothetical protein
MERELVWMQVYRTIVRVAKVFPLTHSGQGHPDIYPTWVVAVCWLWSCLWREPLAVAMRTLRSAKKRRLYGHLGFRLPRVVPEGSTVCRRMQRPDFQQVIDAIQRSLIDELLGEHSCHTLVADSSPLDIPTISHDPDARFGHHGHFGYRFHTLITQDRIILEQAALPTNVQELAVLPQLIEQASSNGIRCAFLAADIGYDSEAAHRKTRDCLGGMLLAPPNDRGGTRAFVRTPLRKQMWAVWRSPKVRAARRKRPRIEHTYSVLKGPFAIDSLPRHIRHLPRVRRFLMAETILYHGYLLAKRLNNAA